VCVGGGAVRAMLLRRTLPRLSSHKKNITGGCRSGSMHRLADRTLLPLSCMPVRSSRLMYSSQPGGTPGTGQGWMGVGSFAKWYRCLGSCGLGGDRGRAQLVAGEMACSQAGRGRGDGRCCWRSPATAWMPRLVACRVGAGKFVKAGLLQLDIGREGSGTAQSTQHDQSLASSWLRRQAGLAATLLAYWGIGTERSAQQLAHSWCLLPLQEQRAMTTRCESAVSEVGLKGP
jgi:hypothetical protein